ncbi:MAG: iron ABC transporter permease [Deltaproteobacteria bacterium]|nr:iron ABC transporter permease [Deltaproteobacteria bacterium]
MIRTSKWIAEISSLGFLFLLTLFTGLSIGVEWISPVHFWDPLFKNIIWDIRWPRVLLAIIAGGALSVSGYIFQIILKNPLADPFILGVSGAACLGGALGFLLHLGYPLITFVSFLTSLLCLGVIDFVSRKHVSTTSHVLLLTGVFLSFLFSSLVTLCLSFSEPFEGTSLLFWLMGGLSFPIPTPMLWISLGILFFLLSFIYRKSYHLHLLNLSAIETQALGIDALKTQRLFFILASLLCALTVSLTGMIGFVGLLVPHLCRFLWGNDPRRILIHCFLVGAILLISMDMVVRTLFPYEMPLGAMTALLGAPFFLFLLWKRSSP